MDKLLAAISTSCAHGSLPGEQCLWRIYGNCRAMFEARGYTLSKACDGVAELLRRAAAGASVLRGCDCADREDIALYLCVEEKVGIQHVRAVLDTLEADQLALFLSVDGPTAFTRREMSQDARIQFLTCKTMFNNITEHALVPKHTRLDAARARAVAGRYSVTQPRQWPKISAQDPVCRFYDFREGDLIEIERRGVGTDGASLYYRIVVSACGP